MNKVTPEFEHKIRMYIRKRMCDTRVKRLYKFNRQYIVCLAWSQAHNFRVSFKMFHEIAKEEFRYVSSMIDEAVELLLMAVEA